MNILIVSPAFAPYSGVGANRMISFVNYLLKYEQNNVTLIRDNPITYPIEYKNSIEPKNIKFYNVNVCKNFKHNEELYFQEIKKVLENEKIDIIFVSVGPFYTLKFLPIIKKQFGINYIIDFRDLWVYEVCRHDGIIKDFKRKILHLPHIIKERKAVKDACKIIVVTEGDKQIMEKKYPSKRNDVYLITNGYDKNRIILKHIDFITNDSFYIGVFGKLSYYNKKYATIFFKSVLKLLNKGLNIKILHIGETENATTNIISKLSFPKDNYINVGMKDYSTGISYLNIVDMTLIIYSSKSGLGTKVFDYIYVNKPILTITQPKSTLASFVLSFNNGFTSNTCAGVCRCIEDLYFKKDIKVLDSANKYLDYDREIQNEKLYKLILKGYSNEESII